jgi:hypothetical protein
VAAPSARAARLRRAGATRRRRLRRRGRSPPPRSGLPRSGLPRSGLPRSGLPRSGRRNARLRPRGRYAQAAPFGAEGDAPSAAGGLPRRGRAFGAEGAASPRGRTRRRRLAAPRENPLPPEGACHDVAAPSARAARLRREGATRRRRLTAPRETHPPQAACHEVALHEVALHEVALHEVAIPRTPFRRRRPATAVALHAVAFRAAAAGTRGFAAKARRAGGVLRRRGSSPSAAGGLPRSGPPRSGLPRSGQRRGRSSLPPQAGCDAVALHNATLTAPSHPLQEVRSPPIRRS